MIPESPKRVADQTATHLNDAIRRRIEGSVLYHARRPEEIDARLSELDREWNVERTLEANAATLATAGALLAALVDRRFAMIPAVVGGFLLQHAIQGWCPPVPVFRRFLFRTPQEVEAERYALKALRGDFGTTAAGAPDVQAVLRAVEPRGHGSSGAQPRPAGEDLDGGAASAGTREAVR